MRYFGSGLAFHLDDRGYPGNWNLYWGALRRTTDYGVNWSDLSNGSLNCAAYDKSLVDGRLWAIWMDTGAITGHWYVYYSDNDGDTWTLNFTIAANFPIVDIACHQTDANTLGIINAGNIYFGTTRSTRITTNRGVAWSANRTIPIVGGLSTLTYWDPPPRLLITDQGTWLALDPNDQILRSTNTGTSWSTVKASTSASVSNTGALMAGGVGGPYFAYKSRITSTTPLYRSTDDGATWTSLSWPTGTVDVRAIAYDAATDILCMVSDTSAGGADQAYHLASASTVTAGLEAWTQFTTAPYEALGDHAYYSVTRWTYETLVVMGNFLYTATNYDYEQWGEAVPTPPTPGEGGGSAGLIQPFKDRLPERFPYPELIGGHRRGVERIG